MIDLIAKCGNNCARCPSYKANMISAEDRQRCSDGWYQYHGFRYSAEKLLREPPRVALLSFSTHGSARHPSAGKVSRATAIARERAPHGAFDGELQADAALSERVAALKCGDQGDVAGRANVLVFPDLSAANIGYKLVEQLAGARAIGPFCQGFAGPLCDLSRGTTVDDIVTAVAVTLALR